MVRVKLQARIARRMPDPLFNTLGTEGGIADALGRNPSHWAALHKEVALLDLLARQHPAAGARAPSTAERNPPE